MNPKVVLSLHALLTADSLILGSLDSVSLRSSSPYAARRARRPGGTSVASGEARRTGVVGSRRTAEDPPPRGDESGQRPARRVTDA